MALSVFELKRKVAHLIFGIITVILIKAGFGTIGRLTILIPLTFAIIKLIKADYFPVLSRAFRHLERPDDLESNPGRSVIAFLVSLWLLLFFFPQPIVLASVMIWSVGDSVGHLFGASFGSIPSGIDRRKNIEGVIIAFLFSVLAAHIFVPRPLAIFGSGIGIFVELLPHEILGRKIPDNFTMPLASAVAMAVVSLFA